MKAQLAAYALRAVRRAERLRLPSARSATYSVVVLVVTGFLITAANLLFTAHAIQANNRDRCASIVRLAHIPIPRPVAGNPSREFAAALETIYRQRARQLGCH